MGKLRKILGKGGGKVIGIIVGTVIGTAGGNPVLGAQIGAAIGSGADTLGRNKQIRDNRQAAENNLDLKQKAEQERLNVIRQRVRQQVQTARQDLQNEQNRLTQYGQEQRNLMQVAQDQVAQQADVTRNQIQIDQDTLTNARRTWQQIMQIQQDDLDKQIHLILLISECCASRDLKKLPEYAAALNPMLMQIIANELLQLCHIDDIDTISWIIDSKFKTRIEEEQSHILLNALRQGKTREALAAIQAGANVRAVIANDPNYNGYHAIHVAAHWGQLQPLKELLLRGANINVVNSSKQNVLFLTIWNCHQAECREVLNYLLTTYPNEMRKQLLITTEDGATALHAIVMNAQQNVSAAIETATKLIRFGADATHKDNRGRTVQMLALEFQQQQLAQAIQEQEQKQSSLDEQLCVAVQSNLTDNLLSAIKAGANVNTLGKIANFPARFPALFIAASYGNLNALKILLHNGASLDSKDSSNHNLLYHTVMNCHTIGGCEVLDYLLANYPREMRKQLHANNDDNQTPLHAISLNANANLQLALDTTKKLIRLGVDTTHKDLQGRTAENLALERGQPSLAKTIREYGTTQALVDERLCKAAGDDNEQALLAAIHAGGNVHALGKNPMFSRFPALLIAAHWGNLNAFKLLMQHGADLEVTNMTNHNLLYLTTWNCQTEGGRKVLDYLLANYPEQMRKQLHATNDDQQTALHATSVNAYVDLRAMEATAAKLIKFGVEVKAKENNGLTAAQLAVARKQFELAMFIDKYSKRKIIQHAVFKKSPESLVDLCLKTTNSHPKLMPYRKQILNKTRFFPPNLVPLIKPVEERLEKRLNLS